jgi:hypothetical protein
LFLPGPGGWFFLLLLGCFLFARPLLLLWDGGTCRHLETGVEFVQHLRIPDTNYVSALFPKVPCLTHSFFGDIAYAVFYQLWQLNGVVLLASTATVLGLTWTYQLARARGLGPVVGPILLVLGLAACSMHWSARCHIFSYLCFLALFYLQFMSGLSERKKTALTALVLLLWVNIHGSFLIGLFVLGVKLVADWLELSWGEKESARRLKWDLTALGAAAMAICFNLRGPGFYTYVAGYLSHPMILLKSNEWRSLDFSLGFQTWSALFVYLILVALWVVPGFRPRLWEFLLVTALFLAGLHTMRLIPYMVIAALLAMGPAWLFVRKKVLSSLARVQPASAGAESEGLKAADGWLRRLLVAILLMEIRVEKQERASKLGAPVYLAAFGVMAAFFLFTPALKIKDFNPERLPVKAVDYIAEHQLSGLGFIYDNWGGYLHWRLGRPVFIDDWTDFYPVPFLEEYVATLMGQAGWQERLDRYKIQYVLIPRSTLLGQALLQSPQWRRAFQDEAGELYVRSNQEQGKY